MDPADIGALVLICLGVVVSGVFAASVERPPSGWCLRLLRRHVGARPEALSSTDGIAVLAGCLWAMMLALPVYALLRAGEGIYRVYERKVILATAKSLVPAGWYVDPLLLAELRWWSGSEWTEHTHGEPRTDEAVSSGWPADGTDGETASVVALLSRRR